MIRINYIEEVELNEVINAKKIVRQIARSIAHSEHISGTHYLSVIIVDIKKIHAINLQYRKIDNPTDVISFAMIDDEENRILPLEVGDIFICKEKIISQAFEYNHSIKREFAFLVTHGIYHLLGYDHLQKDQEEIMFEKQENTLKLLKITR